MFLLGGYPGNYYSGEYLCYSTGGVYDANSWAFDSSCIVEGGFSGGSTGQSVDTAVGINVERWNDVTYQFVL